MVTGEMVMEQENFTDLSTVLGPAQQHILAAQFECFLKMIHDPPQTEEGDKTAPFLLIKFYVFSHPAELVSCMVNTF